MDSVKDMLLLLISSSIVSNIVLSQFMGLCPFLGVSRKIKTAGGMGTAVIFVITLASAVAGVIYKFILQPLHIEYLETIVFILVIAALVQFVEMFLKKFMKSLYQALGVYLPLITTNMGSNDILSLAGSVVTNGIRTVDQMRFPEDSYSSGQTIKGIYYYVFNRDSAVRSIGRYIYLDEKTTN